MNDSDNNAIVMLPAATCATNATQTMSFTGQGYDRLNLYLNIGTHATDGASIGTLKLSESDTVTSPSSMTDIVAFTGGTETSSTVGFVIPGADELGPGSVIAFQVDLKKRKKYLGLSITPGSTTMNIGAIGLLSKSGPEGSADTASEKSISLNHATNSTSCAKVISG